ncbi:hypothetical protein L596_009363 [Steinernema carpocapsae]|uniref:Uncharacterized protein n=1 Tax=Steinernema carpocapsae TaxID=34508 RepID=A0A4U5PF49_STECR|nr:hypothetical protein L596_009363 [Steinernema carpocapsae]
MMTGNRWLSTRHVFDLDVSVLRSLILRRRCGYALNHAVYQMKTMSGQPPPELGAASGTSGQQKSNRIVIFREQQPKPMFRQRHTLNLIRHSLNALCGHSFR